MSSLCWLTILALVTTYLAECSIFPKVKQKGPLRTIQVAHPIVTDGLSPEWVEGLLHSSEGFLAGEDTPVWIAHCPSRLSRVRYKRLENGIVKKAADYWNSTEYGGLTSRRSRSVNSRFKFDGELRDLVEENLSAQTRNNNRNGANSRTKRRSLYETPKVVQPSILVMMDYTAPWPEKEEDQQRLIFERILYALAFWNGIDLQFRHVKNPQVRFRIAGIIIGQNREATPYLREHEGPLGLEVKLALPSMLNYWTDIAEKDYRFPAGTYHIIATMTDAEKYAGISSGAYAISSPGPPCKLFGYAMEGVILPDDLAFSGMQVAVHETAHVMGAITHDGAYEDCPMIKGNVLAPNVDDVGRIWSACSLRRISEALKYSSGACMEKPREFNPPGKPIDPILPGKLMSASEQCKGRGWVDGNVCWAKTSCDNLYCSNNEWYSRCKSAGAPADGTTCGPTQICLDGKCVGNVDMSKNVDYNPQDDTVRQTSKAQRFLLAASAGFTSPAPSLIALAQPHYPPTNLHPR